MRKTGILFTLCLFVVSACVGLALTQIRRNSPGQPANTSAAAEKDTGIASLLHDKRLITFNRWATERDGHTPLSYVVRAFEQDANFDGSGVKLTVYDGSGTAVYENYYSWIDRIYSQDVLRNGSMQLVMQVNDGGNEDFLEILDYQNGKVVNVTKAVEPNNDFGSHADVRPQFHSSVNPAVEPFEIYLTQPGLAGAGEKYTSVYRYKNGAYRYAGEFSQKDADDFIEKLMAKNAANKAKPTKP